MCLLFNLNFVEKIVRPMLWRSDVSHMLQGAINPDLPFAL
jgi:hypothetical protein